MLLSTGGPGDTGASASRRGGAWRVSLVVQQQHDGVELPAGSVVGPQRHDEVVQPVARRLRRHDDQLVLEAVSLGVLVAVVFAALPRARGRPQPWDRDRPLLYQQNPGSPVEARFHPEQAMGQF